MIAHSFYSEIFSSYINKMQSCQIWENLCTQISKKYDFRRTNIFIHRIRTKYVCSFMNILLLIIKLIAPRKQVLRKWNYSRGKLLAEIQMLSTFLVVELDQKKSIKLRSRMWSGKMSFLWTERKIGWRRNIYR